MKSILPQLVLLAATFFLKPETAFARTNGALEFNGTGAYIETGRAVIPSSGDFSVEVWYYCPTGISGRREILSQGSQGNALYIGRDLDGRLRMGDSWYDAPIELPTGGWHHLALVKSSTDTRLYIDGVFRISKGAPIANPATGDGLRLGSQYGGYGEYWQGELDDVRIWNRVLSADEIQANFRRMPDGTEPGLVAAWEFDENANNLCTSVGSSRITCTLGGAQWTNSGVLWIEETPYEEPEDYAVAFNGTGGYLDTGTPLIPTSGDFTIEFWAVCPSSSGLRNVLSQGTDGHALYIGKHPDNTLRLGDGWWDSGIVFPIGGWHHFALVKSSTDTVFYLDGIARARKGSAIPNPTAGSGLRIGAQFGSYGEYWAGGVDDVRIWNRALDAEEIRVNRFLLPEADALGLVAAWEFNEGPGQNSTAIGSSTSVELSIGNGTGWMESLIPWQPRITSQPESVTAFQGTAAQLSVSATGYGPFAYQWYRENRGAVAGATNAILSWSSLEPSDAGIYYAEVSNANGTSASRRVHVAPISFEWNGDHTLRLPVNSAFNDPGATISTPAIAASAGFVHSLAVKADGSVIGWGDNLYGQTTVPSAATNVVAIAAGDFHTLALKTDGSVVAWTLNDYTQCNVPATATDVTAVAAGSYHSLALKANGSVIAWGRNDSGQSTVPASATNVVAIAAGGEHSLALKADGAIVAWGRNDYGQISVPTSATNVAAIAAGRYHSVAVRADGSVIAWGDNSFSQCAVPPSAANAVAIAAGVYHSVALKADGSVIAWGNNQFRQLFVPTTAVNIVGIAAGGLHSLALRSDNTVITWGKSDNGQCSVPSFSQNLFADISLLDISTPGTYTVTYSYTNSLRHVISTNRSVEVVSNITGQPSPVSAQIGSAAELQVQVGDADTLSFQWYRVGYGAIAGATNTVLSWSNLSVADAGDYYVVVSDAYGSETSRRVRVMPLNWAWNGSNPLTQELHTPFIDPGVVLTLPVSAISAGGFHNLALKVDGSITAWGFNGYGQTNVPAAATNVMAIAAGYHHSLALKTDGSVIAWGQNDVGQTTVPTSATDVTAIAAGNYHSLALKQDGSVVVWGYNESGETEVPTEVTNMVAIAVGDGNFMALRADGHVVAWGHNSAGQCDVPASATNVTAIAAGNAYGLALKADGSLIAWGSNNSGQCNVPASATNVTAIAAGQAHGLALKHDGSVIAWGNNFSGESDVPAAATNVIAVSAGFNHSLALRSDGSVVVWGNNEEGECNVPSLSKTLMATGGTVDTATPGTYTLTYSYTNSAGQVVSTTRTVEVVSTRASGLGITNITYNAVGGTFGFNITATSGGTVIVESCTNLVNPVWIPVQTNTLGESPVVFTDSLQPEIPSRFYRVTNPAADPN